MWLPEAGCYDTWNPTPTPNARVRGPEECRGVLGSHVARHPCRVPLALNQPSVPQLARPCHELE